jgi:hypothetical protein
VDVQPQQFALAATRDPVALGEAHDLVGLRDEEDDVVVGEFLGVGVRAVPRLGRVLYRRRTERVGGRQGPLRDVLDGLPVRVGRRSNVHVAG